MDNQDTFMKQIIDETYRDDAAESSPSNLVNYFEKRLNEVDYLSLTNYLVNEEILFIPMNLIEQTKCYRISLGNTLIDFPSNWSIFNNFSMEKLVYVNANKDEDFLCEIFLSYVGEVKILVLANDNIESKLIFLCNDFALKHLEWIENYFIKQADILQIKKAA